MKRLVIVLLALFLAAPAGICLDCCCEPDPVEQTGCCSKSDGKGSERVTPVAGCECPDLAIDTAYAAAPTTSSCSHSQSTPVAEHAIADGELDAGSTSLDSTRLSTPPSARSRFRSDPRAPPTLSL